METKGQITVYALWYLIILVAFFTIGVQLQQSFIDVIHANVSSCANGTMCGTIIDMLIPFQALAILFTPIAYIMVARG